MILGESKPNPEKSCKDILAVNKNAVSGIYWIKPQSNRPFQVYLRYGNSGGARAFGLPL